MPSVLLEGFPDDALKFGGSRGAKLQRPLRHAVNQRVEKCCGSLSLKRQRARSHLVKHDSERKQIRAGIERPAQRLLGRHVGDSSQGIAGAVRIIRRLCDIPKSVAAENRFVTLG